MTIHRYLLPAVLALGLLGAAATAPAADPAPAAAATETKAPDTKKTLLDRIKDGGLIMIPIGICSIMTAFLMVDGFLRTSRKRTLPEMQVGSVKGLFRQGDYVGAFEYCKRNPSAFTNVCRIGIGLLGEGKAQVEEGIVGELAKENSQMQTYISYLSVIGVCTPMIGLLGTVAGMISAFDVLGHTGIGDPSQLSQAIGEVLIATASGLFIAIPAFGSYYYLRARAAKALHDIQDTMNALFRKMPYEQLAGVHIGDDELYAATPNWISSVDPTASANV
jgi:biopolymer transport protein ExbB